MRDRVTTQIFLWTLRKYLNWKGWFNIILSDVMRVVDRFGPKRVIIKNSPYQGEEGKTMRLCVQPEMITRVIREIGCS